ncbi:hypothetical protein [Xanthomonas arboricola]|uniref:hypothetical protein n=1 Tax=Xanthomonas arboricola TaxID=56448 RepID=UPI003EBC4053
MRRPAGHAARPASRPERICHRELHQHAAQSQPTLRGTGTAGLLGHCHPPIRYRALVAEHGPIYPSKQKSKDDGDKNGKNKDKDKDRADEQPKVEQQGYDISAEYQCYLTKPQPWDSGYTPPAR